MLPVVVVVEMVVVEVVEVAVVVGVPLVAVRGALCGRTNSARPC